MYRFIFSLWMLPLVVASSEAKIPTDRGGSVEDGAAAFDFYVLAMSYQPEFCHKHLSSEFVGCKRPNEFWKGDLTIHGLWPQWSDGTWPSSCTNEEFHEETVKEIGVDRFEQYWPNVKAKVGSPGYTDFWQHEWLKHGTCSTLSQVGYFKAALDNFLETPDIVKDSYGASASKSALLDAYGGRKMVATVCQHNRYLSEVRSCFGMKNGEPTERIECPETVLAEDNCGNEIVMASFESDSSLRLTENVEMRRHMAVI